MGEFNKHQESMVSAQVPGPISLEIKVPGHPPAPSGLRPPKSRGLGHNPVRFHRAPCALLLPRTTFRVRLGTGSKLIGFTT